MAHAFRAGFLSARLCFLTCLIVYCRQDTLKTQIYLFLWSRRNPLVGWGSVGRAARGPSPGQGEPAAAELNHGGKEGAEGGLYKMEITCTQTQKLPFLG